MKKIILLFLFISSITKPAFGQIDWGQYSQTFPEGVNTNISAVGIITAIPMINNSFWLVYKNETLSAALMKDTAFRHYRTGYFFAVNTFDTAKAHFFLHGVNKGNASEYEFRVVENNDKIIRPWGSITDFTNAKLNAQLRTPPIAYLGGYSTTLGNKIIVDVRKRGHKNIWESSVVAWVSVKPLLTDIYTTNDLNIFFLRLTHPWDRRVSFAQQNKWKNYPPNQLDNRTSLPKKLILEPTDNNLVFYFEAEIYYKEQLEYELIKNDEVAIQWRVNDFDNNFVWLRNLSPGRYMIRVRYSAQRQHVTVYAFEIKTPWYRSAWLGIAATILATGFFGLIISLLYNIKQKQNAAAELSKKTSLQLELKAIYAQLNPHFIFNALSSIQGLINKQDIKAANSYLSDFARLMRETLNNSNKEQTPLKQELVILETYLKLERLRFGFRYELYVDENINIYETETPSLLLQPLLENAVKHGVAGLQEKGIITINFSKRNDSMVVIVTDNGRGFIMTEHAGGFGLKLTRDRIKLLNAINKGQIIFEITVNQPAGTQIALTFENWFL